MAELSEKAARLRSEYNRKWRAENAAHVKEYRKTWGANNPERIRANFLKFWEKKAAEHYGDEYQGPGAGKLSAQAQEMKRRYNLEYRHRNREKVRAAQRDYWERKAAAS